MIEQASREAGAVRRRSPALVVWAKVAAGFTLSAVLLYLALGQVNGTELLALVRQARYPYVVAAVGVYFADVAFRSARWRILLRPTKDIPSQRLYPVLAIGYMANNLLPGRIGELSRAVLVARREHVSGSTVLASVAIERIIDGLTVLALLFAMLLVLPSSGLPGASWIVLVARLAAITFGIAFLGCAALVVARGSVLRLAARLVRALPERIADRLLALLDRFIAGFAVLRDPRLLVSTAVLSLAIWVVGATTYILVAAAFDVHLTLAGAIAAICIVNLATAVPQAPGGVGAFEVAAKEVLVLLGAGSTVAFGITIVLHAVLFVPVVLVGLAFLWQADLSLGALWTRTHPAAPVAAAEL